MLGERYRILRRIGEGGMGTVYLCEHVVLHRRVAVKVLRPDVATDAEIVERFHQEAIAASQIGQENVVDVFDFGRSADGELYYVMEALEGHNLGTLLRAEGPLPVARALTLVEQICRALGAAHSRGVVHRDLKPENVFVIRAEDGSERVKLLDFGISKVKPQGTGERLTRTGSIIGTPEYMAPEQAAGSTVDHRADVYALGVLAYELLTGALPLEGENAIATLVAHQTVPPEAPSRRRAGVPPEVDALVLRALAKRPEDRFDSMPALLAELARIRARVGTRGPDQAAIRRDRAQDRAPGPDDPPRPITRSGTVALDPDASHSVRARVTDTVRRRRAHAAAGKVALFLVVAIAAFGGWWLRGASVVGRLARSPGPLPRAAMGSAAAPAVPTSTPTPTPIPTATPIPIPTSSTPTATSAAGSTGDAPAAVAPRPISPRPGRRGDAARRHDPRTAAVQPEPGEEDGVDPYGPGDELKPNPF